MSVRMALDGEIWAVFYSSDQVTGHLVCSGWHMTHDLSALKKGMWWAPGQMVAGWMLWLFSIPRSHHEVIATQGTYSSGNESIEIRQWHGSWEPEKRCSQAMASVSVWQHTSAAWVTITQRKFLQRNVAMCFIGGTLDWSQGLLQRLWMLWF